MDGLEIDWGDSVQVVRVNVHEAGAKPLLTQLNFQFTPTFILLDRTGEESWRMVGVIDPEIAKQQVTALP